MIEEADRHCCDVVKRILSCADPEPYLRTHSGATEVIQCHCASFPSLQRHSIIANNVEIDIEMGWKEVTLRWSEE